MTAPRVLAVIPARGGSKGLPNKNILPLAGRPLIAHSIDAAARSSLITRCIVSTDSPEIRAVAAAHGGDAPFLRPTELAQDDTPMAPVLRHALEWADDDAGEPYDAVLLLDPTSPVRRPDQFTAAAELLTSKPELDGIVTVSEPTFNPLWVGVRAEDPSDATSALQRYFEAGQGLTRRQDAGRFLRINGNFYLWRAPFVRRLQQSWFDEGRHAGFEIPEAQAYSIDDAHEFHMLEALINAGYVRPVWEET